MTNVPNTGFLTCDECGATYDNAPDSPHHACGAAFVCEVPPALGRVTKIKSQGGKVFVETESGTQMIVPTFNK